MTFKTRYPQAAIPPAHHRRFNTDHIGNINEPLRQDIINCINEGMTRPEICDELGIHPAKLRGQMTRMGLKCKKKKSPK